MIDNVDIINIHARIYSTQNPPQSGYRVAEEQPQSLNGRDSALPAVMLSPFASLRVNSAKHLCSFFPCPTGQSPMRTAEILRRPKSRAPQDDRLDPRAYGKGVKIAAHPPPGAKWTLSLSFGFTRFVLMAKLVPTESASGPSEKICASY